MGLPARCRLPARRSATHPGDMDTRDASAQPVALPAARSSLRLLLPGLLASVAVAAAATVIGRVLPLLGAPVTAILLGVGLSAPARTRPALRPGIRLAAGVV